MFLPRHALHCTALQVDGQIWRASPAEDIEEWLVGAERIIA
jgi:hypothetical protein